MATLVVDEEDKFIENCNNAHKKNPSYMKNPFKQSLVVSLSFMSVFTAYLSIQNLQSSLNHEAGLGISSLAVLYGAIILSGTLAPPIIRIIGAKRSLVLSWICHTLYTASNFYPTWMTLIPSSILVGLTAGPMWTSQGIYLTACGTAYAHNQGEKLYGVLSKLNSIFFTCYETTDLFGNIISSLILTRSSYNKTLFLNTTKTCGAGSGPDTFNSVNAVVEPETHIVYILLSVFLLFDLAGLGLTAGCLTPLQKDEQQEKRTLLGSCTSCFTALADIKLLLIIPLFMATAMSQGILFTEYTKSFISCALGIYHVGFIMSSHGVVTAVTSILMGRVVKYTGRIPLLVVAVVFNMGMLFVMLFWNPLDQHYAMFFIIPVGLGISEGILRMQFNSFIGIEFYKTTDSAFANYHTWNAIAFTLTFTAGMFVSLTTRLYFVLTLMGIGLSGYLSTEVLIRHQNRRETGSAINKL